MPVRCPHCGQNETLDGLSKVDKQFLIDSTLFHSLWAEHQLLLRMNDIITFFPGTQHPLLVEKLPPSRQGRSDDVEVDRILDRDPELREFLTQTSFLFNRRFPWVDEVVRRDRKKVDSGIVRCRHCDHIYMVLEDEYYSQIG